jgi:NADPH:quinone reductase-like Zn-dependent oxidoreductase
MARAVQFDTYGDVDVLHLAEVEVPLAGRGQVVVAVKAAGTNPGEAKIRSGAAKAMFPATFPSGQGSDLAGVVTEVGDGVEGIVVGQEVLGWSNSRSTQADYVVVPADQLVPKPAELSWEVAGSLHVIGVTAYAAAAAVGAGSGDTVAVSAAAGGVGSVTVQLLKVRGANVLGIASEGNHEWLRSVGVIPVGYGDGLADRLRAAAPDGIDAFIDTFGPEYVELALELGIDKERINTITAFAAAKEHGVKSDGSQTPASIAAALTEIADLVANGKITVPIAATYPLEEVQAAYTELEQGHTHGKIVLIP